MNDRNLDQLLDAWLDLGPTTAPDRVSAAASFEARTTRQSAVPRWWPRPGTRWLQPDTDQRRAWWPVRRFPPMNNLARIAIAAAAVIVVAIFGYGMLGRSNSVGPPAANPTLTPTPTPTASESTTPAGFLTSTPFLPSGFGMCPPARVSPDCTEDPRDDSMTFTYQIPEGWEGAAGAGGSSGGARLMAEGLAPPAGAYMLIHRGNWLYSDPCRPDDAGRPDIPVGPTVDDFATALDTHPLLDVTTPVDVTLAGYSGKYVELQVPSDISECVRYRPIEATLYAQGPGNRWRFWILDVDGIRVVIQTGDYARTSAQHQAELQDIVDSIQVEP